MKGKCEDLSRGRDIARPDTKSIFFAENDLHPYATAGGFLYCCGTVGKSCWQLEIACLFMDQPTCSSCAKLHAQYSISAATSNRCAYMQVYSPFAYLLPDTFIIDTLHNPIDTALIQGHKLRGHQVTCASVAVHPEL